MRLPEYYVLDPAIEPSGPLPLRAWILRQVRNVGDVTLCVCAPHSPNSSCTHPGDSTSQSARDQQTYLRWEWSRQRELGRDPTVVLGEHPPWEQNTPARRAA